MSKMNDAKHVGEGLRRLRLHHDFKQEFVASVMEISASQVSGLEKGIKLLTIKHLTSLATVYNMPVYDIVYFIEHYADIMYTPQQVNEKLQALLNAQMYLNV